MSSARHWCFTINNPVESLDEFYELVSAAGRVKYLVCQLEAGESGTPHIQGYIQLDPKIRLKNLKELIGETAHCEVAKGNAESNRTYCTKAEGRIEGPLEHGSYVNHQGSRSDLEAVAADVKAGSTLKELAENHPVPYIKFTRGIKSLRAALGPERTEPPEVTLLFGPPGCGKTSRVFDSEPDVWLDNPGQGMWFDGFDFQDAALFDDFAGAASHCTLSEFLRYIDRYPVRAPIKGDFTRFPSRRIFITTNIHPSKWWDFSSREEQYPALVRRISTVIWWKSRLGDPVILKSAEHAFYGELNILNRDPWSIFFDGPALTNMAPGVPLGAMGYMSKYAF